MYYLTLLMGIKALDLQPEGPTPLSNQTEKLTCSFGLMT